MFFLCAISFSGFTQIVYRQGQPDADSMVISSLSAENILFDINRIDSLERVFKLKPGASTFAVKKTVAYNPLNSGKVIRKKDGNLVWYLKIYSSKAKSLNVIFSKFSLVEGEEVYIYNTDLQSVRGPYTGMNNKKGGSLAVMPVSGDEIILEYHMSSASQDIRLEVGQVAHDFIGITGRSLSKDFYFGNSQACNVDINCESGKDWQLEKRSVVRIIAGGTELGSGFLVNNTRQENIPFVLTANHVIREPEFATNSIYVFRYESPFCDGPDGMVDYSLSGAELMAEDFNTDFTLVRLDEFPPLIYKPYMAGWDVRGNIPDRTVTIHHPSGDVKKISTDNNPPVISTFQNLYEDGFWKVLQWDEGTTEGGSSGSPLFDQNHRAVGYLTGGEAVCGNSVNDYFGRMDIAYDLNSGISNSLEPWLDPANTGVLVFDGRDPYADITASFDTINNCGTGDRFITAYDLPATGYTTGFNSDSIIMYAEKFIVEPSVELTGVIMETGDARFLNSFDSISVFIMSDLNQPESVLARRSVFLREARDSTNLIFDFIRPVSVPEEFFVAWHLWYSQQASAEQQQLAVFHSSPVSVSLNTAYFKDLLNWHPFYEHPFMAEPLHLCLSVVLTDSLLVNIEDSITGNAVLVRVYPNPVSDILFIKMLDNNSAVLKYSVINNAGVNMLYGIFENSAYGSVNEIDVSCLAPGVYYLLLENINSYSVHKLIKK